MRGKLGGFNKSKMMEIVPGFQDEIINIFSEEYEESRRVVEER